MSLSMELVAKPNENRCSMSISFGDDLEQHFNISAYQKISRTPERVAANKKRTLDKLNAAFEEAKAEGNLVQAETIRDDIINTDDFSDGEKLTSAVNDFYEFLPEEKQRILFDYYTAAKDTIWKLTSTNHREIRKVLSKLTTAMFQAVEIDVYALKFVRIMNFPLPSFENTGMRSHDTMKMTHDRESYIMTTGMCIISKAMVPVWGDYCAALAKIGMATIHNDFYCLSIIAPAYRQSPTFSAHYQRLFEYCQVSISKGFEESLYKVSTGKDKAKNREDNSFIASKCSYDYERFELLIFGFVIVKRMVAFDLWTSVLKEEDRQPNLMIYISSRVMPFTVTTLKQMNDSSKLSPRFEPKENMSIAMEENNVTHLENSSRVSRVPMDYPIIICEGTKHSLKRAVKEQGINEKEFWEACEFYNKHSVAPSILSNAIVSIVLSPMLGVSKNMGYLDAEVFHMGCAYTQFMLARAGAKYDQLLVLLTAGDDGLGQANTMEPIKVAIRNSYKHVPLFHDVVANFPHTCEQVTIVEEMVGGRRKKKKRPEKFTIKQQIDRVCEWLYSNDHHINLWPGFWKKATTIPQQKQGSVFVYNERMMEDFYQFLLDWCPSNHLTQKKDAK